MGCPWASSVCQAPKPVYATLAQMSYVYVGYIVDSWVMNAEKQLFSEVLFALLNCIVEFALLKSLVS